MKPAPRTLYKNVFIFGSMADPPTVGGWLLQPHLALSYLLAARYVIEGGEQSRRLSEVGIPAAYLQRHALELELKDIIEGARGIAADQKWLDGPVTAPYQKPKPAELTHYLVDEEVINAKGNKKPKLGLLSLAQEALKEAGLDEIPAAIVELVTDLSKLDDGAPDRFRYSQIKGRPGTNSPAGERQRSFEERTPLYVVSTQERFEALYHEHLALRDFDDEWNFGTWLSREAHRCGEDVERRSYEAPQGSAPGSS